MGTLTITVQWVRPEGRSILQNIQIFIQNADQEDFCGNILMWSEKVELEKSWMLGWFWEILLIARRL